VVAISCSESSNCTGWKACATKPFMVLGVPSEHEWLVPKLHLGTQLLSKLSLDKLIIYGFS
jgi:hypothetical protein